MRNNHYNCIQTQTPTCMHACSYAYVHSFLIPVIYIVIYSYAAGRRRRNHGNKTVYRQSTNTLLKNCQKKTSHTCWTHLEWWWCCLSTWWPRYLFWTGLCCFLFRSALGTLSTMYWVGNSVGFQPCVDFIMSSITWNVFSLSYWKTTGCKMYLFYW